MVSWTDCSALWTVSLSLLTDALADARFASRVAVLIVGLEEEDGEPEPEEDAAELVVFVLRSETVVVLFLGEPLCGLVVLVGLLPGALALGAVLVGSLLGAVLVGVVEVGVALAGAVLAGVVLVGATPAGVVVVVGEPPG